MRPLIIIGFGAHGRVIADIATEECGRRIIGYTDNVDYQLDEETLVDGIKYLGGDSSLEQVRSLYPQAEFILGVGSITVRKRLIESGLLDQLPMATLISTSAIVSKSARIGVGTVVLRGAIINTNSIVENHAIINSGCIIEHDALVKMNAHIGPGACMGGGSCVGSHTLIGTNATLLPRIVIGSGSTLGAGAVLTKSAGDNEILMGIPAKMRR